MVERGETPRDRVRRLEGGRGGSDQAEMVGHEPGVEAAALQGLRETDQVLEIEIGVGIGAWVAPPGGMNADRAHERAQMQLAWSGHRCPVLSVAPSWAGCRSDRNIRGVGPKGCYRSVIQPRIRSISCPAR